MVDEELASTAQAIEAASQRIQEMLDKSREDDTGVKLEVNERLLDSCTNLMKAISVLFECSKDLQVEIVEEGMVSEREEIVNGEERSWGMKCVMTMLTVCLCTSSLLYIILISFTMLFFLS